MADKVKEKYPIFGDGFDLEDLPASFSGSSFICLEILGCNSRKAWSFSDARLDLQAFPESEIDAERKFVSTVNETIVFRGAVYDLLVNKNNNIQALYKIFESLGDFLTNGKGRMVASDFGVACEERVTPAPVSLNTPGHPRTPQDVQICII